jgi:hypothetical protein
MAPAGGEPEGGIEMVNMVRRNTARGMADQGGARGRFFNVVDLVNRLEAEAPRMASRRTLSARRLPCHEHGAARRERRCLLQQAWDL